MASVLVIDDDQMVTRLLQEHLSNEGHEVAVSTMAEKGFQMALTSSPDVILLDVMLPDATGFQMVGRLRENPLTQTIPIIMMTGTARHTNQQNIAKNMGADDYFLKPFDVFKVSESVQQLVKVKHEMKPKPAPAPVAVLPTPVPQPVAGAVLPPLETAALPPARSFDLPALDFTMENVVAWLPDWLMTAGIFATHLVVAAAVAFVTTWTDDGIYQAMANVMQEWTLLLGLVVAVSATLDMRTEARDALRIARMSAIPIIFKASQDLSLVMVHSKTLSSIAAWTNSLHLFGILTLLIMGTSLQKLQGSSRFKSVLATMVIAVTWSLLARG